jgi:hypothetical protein
MKNVSCEALQFVDEQVPFPGSYPADLREAWSEVLINCWKEGDDDYINAIRLDPLRKLQGNPKIDESKGKYFPLPDKPPPGVPNPADSPENEEALKAILKEHVRHFGQMMMGGGWPENDAEIWIDIIIRAWKDPEFLQSLRDNPKATLERAYPSLSASLGKFFPIAKERPTALKGLSDEELKSRLNESGSKFMGWMMACCR